MRSWRHWTDDLLKTARKAARRVTQRRTASYPARTPILTADQQKEGR
jgi:hypothetical protein